MHLRYHQLWKQEPSIVENRPLIRINVVYMFWTHTLNVYELLPINKQCSSSLSKSTCYYVLIGFFLPCWWRRDSCLRVTVMAEHTAQHTGHWAVEIHILPVSRGEQWASHGHMGLALGRRNKQGWQTQSIITRGWSDVHSCKRRGPCCMNNPSGCQGTDICSEGTIRHCASSL